MTDERRRITWGNQDATHDPEVKNYNLDPFTIDVFGRLFNAHNGQECKPLTRNAAAKSWNKYGNGGRWYELDLTKTNHRGDRIPGVKAEDLLVTTKTIERRPGTSWLFIDRIPQEVWSDVNKPMPKPIVRFQPADTLASSGDTDVGWFLLRPKDRFVSLFHGPSLAAFLWNDI